MSEHEWKIAKSGQQCSACSAALNVVGKTYFSALFNTPEGLNRRDFCEECFQKNRPDGVYYFWKTLHRDEEEKNKRRQPVVDVDFVLDFFKRLEGEPGEGQPQIPQRLPFRYILALMLTRKKVLVQDERRKNAAGQDVQVFKERRGGTAHEVVEPNLSADEISAVSAELGALLGLKAPEAPAAAPAPATGEADKAQAAG
ncbi:MAG TPA: hypothetical protein VEJ63_00305 [Planctomycetota bacterium]|nr:hypothetical protein [Planctomycetota bacterium]